MSKHFAFGVVAAVFMLNASVALCDDEQDQCVNVVPIPVK